MNVVELPPTHQQGSPPSQFQNICKICKKLYKDQAGLMEHQRQQHSSISIAQKIQRLQMNRINREVQSVSTPQKPPGSLKPKMQSRKQQFHSPNGESFLREENNDNLEETWPKRSKKEDDPPTIISGTVAAATAACYSPLPGTSSANGNGTAPSLIPTQSASSLTNSTSNAAIQMSKQQIFKNKMNPQLLSKIQQNISSGNVSNRNQPMSPNGKPGISKIPKLMSRTKAQYQILKSQVMRPNMVGKAHAGTGVPPKEMPNLLPQVQRQAILPSSANSLSIPRLAPPKSQKMINMEYNNNPQQTIKPEVNTGGRGGGRQNKLPPPRTVPKMATPEEAKLVELQISKQFKAAGARRGNLSRGTGRLEVVRGRGGTAKNSRRQSSLHSPEPSGSGSGSDADEYGYSTPSPPPKKFRDDSPPSRVRGNSSPNRGRSNSSPIRGKNSTSPNRGRNSSPPKKISTPSPEKNEEERIYGKEYKCPPIDKVASYLTKKGLRIWICLVCEETEKEISRGPMICCDGCEDWYHFFCVGIDSEPPAHEKWFCKRCIYKTLHKKTVSKSESEPDSDSDSMSDPPPKSKRKFSKSPSPTRRGRGGGVGRGFGRGRARGRGRI